MKKYLLVLFVACTMLLAGCGGDVSTKLSDGNTALITVGKTKITKNDLYNTMKTDDGSYLVTSMAGEYIVNAEIETTDEITEQATKLLTEYKEKYGDDFQKALDQYGYSSEEDLLDALVTSVKAEKLVEKYFEDNKEAIYQQYAPVKAKMIYVAIDSEDTDGSAALAKANEAYEAIKAGTSFDEVSTNYSSKASLAAEAIYTREDSSVDKNVLQYLVTADAPGLSSAFLSSDSKGYYIVQVTVTNREQIEADFLASLKENTDFSKACDNFYFDKHGFTVYDVDVYNDLKENYPDYLVQD